MKVQLATEWSNHFEIANADRSSCTEEVKETEEAKELKKSKVVGREFWKQIDLAIDQCQLKGPNSSNKGLFAFARRVRAIERLASVKLSPTDLTKCFNRWHKRNRQFLRQDNDYLLEFLVKLGAVRCPFGSNLQSVLEEAKRGTSPSAIQGVKDEDAHLVAKLCRELQKDAGAKPFFLTGRACAEVIGRPHRTVANWLSALQILQIIELVEPGRPGFGSRYRYIATD